MLRYFETHPLRSAGHEKEELVWGNLIIRHKIIWIYMGENAEEINEKCSMKFFKQKTERRKIMSG